MVSGKSNNNGTSGLLINMILVFSGNGTQVDAPSGVVMLFGLAPLTEGAVSQSASIERDAVTTWRCEGVPGFLPQAISALLSRLMAQ